MRRTRWPEFVVLLALTLSACTGSPAGSADPPPEATTTPAEPSATLPVIGPPCLLELGDADVPLEEPQAIDATALAARAWERPDPVRYLAGRLGPPLADRPQASARALLGYAGPALTCDFLQPLLRDQRVGTAGLTPRAARLRREIQAAFGDLPMGGFAAGGVSTGHTDNSSHYEGRALDVFVRPHTDRAQARRGWVLAQWLVARGGQLDVLSVIYRDHIWTIWASFLGWRDYEHPSGDTRDPVLRHLDHVHTAVIGGPYRPDED